MTARISPPSARTRKTATWMIAGILPVVAVAFSFCLVVSKHEGQTMQTIN